MGTIFIVGLGAGDLEQMPLGVYRSLKGGLPLYFRTREHPAVKELEKEGLVYESFDHIYEQSSQFEEVYLKIAEGLLQEAKDKDLVYAVPGHPLVAEQSVQLLLEKAPFEGIKVVLKGGQSFLDALFQSVLIDPIDGFQLLDGTNLHRDEIQLTQHIIIGQVYDTFTASNVKLELMEILPDDYEIYIVERAGTKEEAVKKVPLYMLDRDFKTENLTSLYIPPVKDERILYKNFTYLRKVIATLRGPQGCPWDKAQTHESLKKYLIEEAYELLEAIDEKEDGHIVEELGDVLLHVMLHAQIGEDDGYFSIDDVIETLTMKMIRRHPHVFGEVVVEDAEEVVKNWQKIKQEEQGRDQTSIFAKMGKGLPAILEAYEIQKAAKKVGFDWDEASPALEKVKEEIHEVLSEIEHKGSKTDITGEIGDLLFSVVNLSRLLDVHPEEALLQTNRKFVNRFKYMEKRIYEEGKTFQDYTLEELDKFWEEAKKEGY